MVGDKYISINPNEEGEHIIITQISKRLQSIKGCARYYYFKIESDNYTLSLTEQQRNKWYKKIDNDEKEKRKNIIEKLKAYIEQHNELFTDYESKLVDTVRTVPLLQFIATLKDDEDYSNEQM